MANPLVTLLQIEIAREGTRGYRPRSSKPYTELTVDFVQKAYPDYSDHATQVAALWQDHGAGDLVKTWLVCEAQDWEEKFLNAGKTFPPLACPAHLVIAPYGMSLQGVTPDSIKKLNDALVAGNSLMLVSDPDAGQNFYQSPCQAVGSNILHAASSTTGSNTFNMPPVDLYFPVAWNSYVQPSMCSLGLIQIFDWLLNNSINYLASDVLKWVVGAFAKDAQGRPTFNGSSAMAAVKAKYSAPLTPPTPPPTVLPTAAPPPAPPASTPVTTTDKQPAGSQLSAVTPTVTRFDNGVSSAWSSASQPTTFNIATLDATSVTLTDPRGVTRDVTGKNQVVVTGTYTAGDVWILNAINAAGHASKTHSGVHGCF